MLPDHNHQSKTNINTNSFPNNHHTVVSSSTRRLIVGVKTHLPSKRSQVRALTGPGPTLSRVTTAVCPGEAPFELLLITCDAGSVGPVAPDPCLGTTTTASHVTLTQFLTGRGGVYKFTGRLGCVG